MTLGYSRHMYAEVVFDQKSAAWIALHQRAFTFLRVVPETIVPINLKAAVVHAAFAVDPLQLFVVEEQAHLPPLPRPPFELAVWKKAKVHTDTHIAFDHRIYSVP